MQQYYIYIFQALRCQKKTTEYELGVARWLSEWEHKEGMMRLDFHTSIRMPCQIPQCFRVVMPCHAIHFITFLWWHKPKSLEHNSPAARLICKTQRFCGFSNSMWYYARPSPSSISFGRFVPFNLWAQRESLARTESVFPRRRPTGEFLSGRFSFFGFFKGS